jgi:hypothetical protein
VSKECKKRLDRLKKILKIRENWRGSIESLKRMRQWVLSAENILDVSWADSKTEETTAPKIPRSSRRSQSSVKEQNKKNKCVTNKEVQVRFDCWRTEIGKELEEGELSQNECKHLEDFLRVLDNARPYLIQCYDLPDFPRTNNDTESAIRKMKTGYRRITGRKNWNPYLLRYGRYIAFYDWWGRDPKKWQQFTELAKKIDQSSFRQMQREATVAQSGQLKRFRFRHQTEKYLKSLEDRWESAAAIANNDTITQTASLH